MKKVLVIGGGVGGLSVAWMLARSGRFYVTLVEKDSTVGGLCSTFEYKNFKLDYGAHKSYSVIPGILNELNALMGEENLKHKKKNSIYLFGQYLDYPIKMPDLIFKMGLGNSIACSIGTIRSIAKNIGRKKTTDSYEDFIINKFGHKLYKLVFLPLANKVWGNPQTLSADIARTRIPGTGILDVLGRALGLKKESANTDADFFYYPKGGFGRLCERMKEEIVKGGGVVLTDTIPLQLEEHNNHINKVVLNSHGKQTISETDFVISAIHLDQLFNLFPEDLAFRSKEVIDLLQKLEYRSLILVYVFINKQRVTNDHWLFFPDDNLIFSRVFEQKNMDADMVPANKTVICCDFTDNEEGNLYRQDDASLSAKCISDLVKIGLIQPNEAEETLVRRFPKFYPRYGLDYRENLKNIYSILKKADNLFLTGRIGFYNYNNSDHCVDMGRLISENLLKGKPTELIREELERRVEEYRIVD